jgi:hypothetical protein
LEVASRIVNRNREVIGATGPEIQSSLTRLLAEYDSAEHQWSTADAMLGWYWNRLSRQLCPHGADGVQLDAAHAANSLRRIRTD